jgi:hypothetical protein
MAEGGFTELFLADIPVGEHDNAEYWMNLDGTEAALALKLRAIVETGSLHSAHAPDRSPASSPACCSIV